MPRVFGLLSAVIAAAASVGLAAPAHAAPECFGRAATILGGPRDERLVGTSGRDVIIGGGGDDVIRGRGGKDVICGFSGDDDIDGGGGADRIDGGMTDDVVRGGDGPDRLLGGDQNDVVHGNAGNDYVDTGNPETSREYDEAYGGLGDDTMVGLKVFGNKGDDVLDAFVMEGGPGNDELIGGVASYADATGPVTADIGAGTATADGVGTDRLRNVTGVAGGAFDDSLTAGEAPARLSGGGGNDVLTGGPDSDDLDGGAGDDTVHASAGDDMLLDTHPDEGTSGNDLLDGGEGADRITYSGLTPVEVDLALDLATGYGTDSLPEIEDVEGTYAADVLLGDDGPNYLYAGEGADVLRGRGGDDQVVDRFDYDDGDPDRLFGDAGADHLWGGRLDELDGGDGDDRLSHGEKGFGGPGDDLFLGVGASDGGEGTDTITFEHTGTVNVDLEEGTAGSTSGTGTVTSIENVIGSPYPDRISGDDVANAITGRGGDDFIDGRGGDDTLSGDAGTDEIDGGPGTDTCSTGEDVTNCEG